MRREEIDNDKDDEDDGRRGRKAGTTENIPKGMLDNEGLDR
jgi:hypothetical protein